MFFLRILFSQPRIFALLLIFIFLSGVFALNTVPRQENPELAQRWSTVQTIYPGASPTRIETQILEPMEAKLREVYELNEIISFASQGFGSVKAWHTWQVQIKVLCLDRQTKRFW